MKELTRLVLVLTALTVVAGLILSLVDGMTREPIARQLRLQTLKAIKAVLPAVDNDPAGDTVALNIGKDRKGKEIKRIFYRGRKGGDLIGVAFKVVSHEGYGGDIDIMVGVHPDGVVTGIEILSDLETPGLGARISEPKFKDQFKGKSLTNADWRVKRDGGQFDQITGATISPRAVVKAVKLGLEFFRDHRAQILAAKESKG
jgi:electron transport complex protein RnfG